MNNFFKKTKLYQIIGILFVSIIIGVSLQVVKAAWIPPTDNPPGGNVNLPVTPWTDNGSMVFVNSRSARATNFITSGIIRGDNGVYIGSRRAISASTYFHTAESTVNSHYGYFEVMNNNGDRGAYLGFGNGGNTVDLALDKASYLKISGGSLMLNSIKDCKGKLYTDAWGVVKCGTINVNRLSSPKNCSGKLYTQNGYIKCGTDKTGGSLGSCHDVHVPDAKFRNCGGGEVMTGAVSYGQNEMNIRCCKLK